MTTAWQAGRLPNLAYLLFLNLAAGRSFCDLAQWPIAPWVLADYTSDHLDLHDPRCVPTEREIPQDEPHSHLSNAVARRALSAGRLHQRPPGSARPQVCACPVGGIGTWNAPSEASDAVACHALGVGRLHQRTPG